jgi:hypothetical protein
VSGYSTPIPTEVAFIYCDWEAMFPEFCGVGEPAATGYFSIATLYLGNRRFCNQVPARGTSGDPRRTILYLLTAHVAKLFASIGGKPSPQVVGRVNQASEGSVSVGLDMTGSPPSAAWFMQTKYGAAAFQAMRPYSLARFVSRVPPYLGVGGYGYGGRGGFGGPYG